MKKYTEEQETVTKKILSTIICDCCGKKVEVLGEYDVGEVNSFNIEFGYGSRYDLSKWHIDACDDCIEKWVDSFKHKIDKDLNGGYSKLH